MVACKAPELCKYLLALPQKFGINFPKLALAKSLFIEEYEGIKGIIRLLNRNDSAPIIEYLLEIGVDLMPFNKDGKNLLEYVDYLCECRRVCSLLGHIDEKAYFKYSTNKKTFRRSRKASIACILNMS